ncbi:MAG: cytochrome c oxidase subunit 3 [Gammaproteobacteria bacterium]|nr:cytochrome c oxidase subunit 3 [Gammaproteobacteria bacterium]
MANAAEDKSIYYVPENGWYPAWLALGIACLLVGLGNWLNDSKAGVETSHYLSWIGLGLMSVVLFAWFNKVIQENHAGMNNAQVKRSYVWGMSWFIFSEVMFFAAFFGALFYARTFAVEWLGGGGDKAITGEYLWPEFKPDWPVMQNPNPEVFTNPGQNMANPGIANWLAYLPFWNTVILLSSSVTVHFAHTAVKNNNRGGLKGWLSLTVLLGVLFLVVQGYEYYHAYTDLGLTLGSGIYGSTFFILTGFHGFHVTLGTFILAMQLVRAFRGHFKADDQFGLEAASWYWHFVDVVWLGLFIFVYLF